MSPIESLNLGATGADRLSLDILLCPVCLPLDDEWSSKWELMGFMKRFIGL